MQSVPEALSKLATLGSVSAIALFFEEKGIKAKPRCVTNCLLAVYLQQETGDQTVAVGTFDAIWGNSQKNRADLPLVLQDLIAHFDGGFLPQLEV
jgi:hypothetical protein